MTLQEMLEQLPEDKRSVVGDYVVSAIEKEKEVGINATKSKNKELLSAQEKLKALGYDKDKYEDFDTFKETISKTKEKVTESSLTIQQLNEKLNEEISKRQEAENKNINSTVQSKLRESLGNKLYGSEFLIDNILLKNELTLDGEQIVTKDGRSYDDFIASTLETNKNNLKSEQAPGSDTLNNRKQQTNLSEEDAFIKSVKDGIK